MAVVTWWSPALQHATCHCHGTEAGGDRNSIQPQLRDSSLGELGFASIIGISHPVHTSCVGTVPCNPIKILSSFPKMQGGKIEA